MTKKGIMENLEEILSGAFLCLMVLLVIINVFLRYFSDYAIYWAEEVATICFVWAVFLGAAATYKRKMDIGIDLLVKRASVPSQAVIKLLSSGVLLLLNAYIFINSLIFTAIAFDKPTAVLGVSSAVVNSALIVGFGFIAFHSLRFLHADWRGFRGVSYGPNRSKEREKSRQDKEG